MQEDATLEPEKGTLQVEPRTKNVMNEQENLPVDRNKETTEELDNDETLEAQALAEEKVESELETPVTPEASEIIEETSIAEKVMEEETIPVADPELETPIAEIVEPAAKEVTESPVTEILSKETETPAAEIAAEEPSAIAAEKNIETPVAEIAAEEPAAIAEVKIETPVAEIAAVEPAAIAEVKIETPVAEIAAEDPAAKAEEVKETPVATIEAEEPAAIAEEVVETPTLITKADATAELIANTSPDLSVFDTHDEDHSDDHAPEYVSEAEVANLKKHSKEELVSMAWEAAKLPELNEASQTFRKLRPIIEVLWNADFQGALQLFIENGGVREDFEYNDPTKEEYNSAYKEFANRREAYRKQLEQEKIKNLEAKRAILNQIKEIAEQEDSSGSLQLIKDLQHQWKAIRAIPNEAREELWNKYTYFLDKFYDNLGINNELKELDRRKNLEVKIELCKKMDVLLEETSLRKTIIMQKKYWEDWKNTGPVPMEAKDMMWERFKEAADKVYDQITQKYQAFEGERQINLDAKIALCERADELTQFEANTAKEWVAKIDDANKLFEEWKAVGPVSNKLSDEIWERFKAAINKFYDNKNTFFKNIEKARSENLRIKNELCTKAEELQNSEDWGNATKSLLAFQDEWKKTGPVHEKHSEKVWTRFRTACDVFFERKKEFFASKIQDETKNLEAKKEIIAKLEELAKAENSEDLIERVKTLQDEWGNYGFVPIKQKDDIQRRFKAVLDAIYQRIRKDFQSNNVTRHRNHYEVIARQTDGKDMLYSEEKRLSERIKLMKHDIDTWQNNMGFFANSKNSAAFTKQIEDKIKDAQKKISGLMDQLRTLRNVKTGKPEEVKTAAPTPPAETKTEEPTVESPANTVE
ncbi:MAG: DUF349 domain-containing protein [Bacteroidota bacterium]|nr:DUF349 domain-containing protein [Bacteroidota bacterium]